MVILEINSGSMFISIIFKMILENTNHCVSTDLSVFDCALFVQVIHEVASSIFASLVLRACYTISLVVLKITNHCVSTDLSVFFTEYPSQCVQYTVSL